tara:strand:+ start:270 stop:665 length:396 start_codon:yes stop_codon:yes gene_type:complete
MSTATEKFNKKYVEVVKVIEKDFSDLKRGDKMLISSPRSISKYIKTIPYGKEKTIKLMRRELAKFSNADNTCPLTTGIFLRIAIEASLETQNLDKPDLPFWRVINERSPITKKLPISKDDLIYLRTKEGLK